MINSTIDMSSIVKDQFTGLLLNLSKDSLDWSAEEERHTTAGVPPLFRQVICIRAQCNLCDGARIPEMFDNRCQNNVYAHEDCGYLNLRKTKLK